MQAMENLATLFQAMTACAAVTGAIVAVLGYRKWKPESIGRRKIELVEQILADFYQAKDVIDWARLPSGWSNEAEKRKRLADESEEERAARDAYYRTIHRLVSNAELFSRLQSRKYQAIAYFGETARQPFDELGDIHSKVMAAASNLIRYYKADGELPENWDTWEETVGWQTEGNIDMIADQLTALLVKLDATYGNWLSRR